MDECAINNAEIHEKIVYGFQIVYISGQFQNIWSQ